MISECIRRSNAVNIGIDRDYLVQVRIAHAKRLLAESTTLIQEIAAMVGYTTSIAFIRVFKKLVGMTPGDYRKESNQAVNSGKVDNDLLRLSGLLHKPPQG